MINKIKEWSGLVALIAIVLFLVFGQHNSRPLGGTTNYDAVQTSKITVGSGGSGIGTIINGTCTLLADFSIASGTPAMVDCQSSSFVAGDYVIIGGYATSSVAITRWFTLQATGIASTTNGYAPVRVFNGTATAVVPSSVSGFGSSTPFTIFRPLTTTPGL